MSAKLSTPEPAPKPSQQPAIWDLVVLDIIDRDATGTAKYGTRLRAGNGRDALVDAYQEALDLVVYLRQAIYEREQAAEAERSAERAQIVKYLLLEAEWFQHSGGAFDDVAQPARRIESGQHWTADFSKRPPRDR